MRDHRAATGPPTLLRRSSVGALALTSAAATAVLLAAAGGPDPHAPASPAGPPAWRTVWSERFPDCVSVVLWPDGEEPVALVTKDPDGRVRRVAHDAPLSAIPGRVTVGACRASGGPE